MFCVKKGDQKNTQQKEIPSELCSRLLAHSSLWADNIVLYYQVAGGKLFRRMFRLTQFRWSWLSTVIHPVNDLQLNFTMYKWFTFFGCWISIWTFSDCHSVSMYLEVSQLVRHSVTVRWDREFFGKELINWLDLACSSLDYVHSVVSMHNVRGFVLHHHGFTVYFCNINIKFYQLFNKKITLLRRLGSARLMSLFV